MCVCFSYISKRLFSFSGVLLSVFVVVSAVPPLLMFQFLCLCLNAKAAYFHCCVCCALSPTCLLNMCERDYSLLARGCHHLPQRSLNKDMVLIVSSFVHQN